MHATSAPAEMARLVERRTRAEGRVRKVERTFAWLHHFKRLLVRYDRRHEVHARPVLSRCPNPSPAGGELLRQ